MGRTGRIGPVGVRAAREVGGCGKPSGSLIGEGLHC
jgi:hypothetical protein